MVASGSTLESVLFVAASLGVVLSTLTVLRLMRSRAAIATKSQKNELSRGNLCD